MSGLPVTNLLAFTSPIRLEYMSWWMATLLFLVLGTFVVLLGVRSLNGLGPARKWVAIVVRLLVVLLTILTLAGLRITRQHKDLEVWVLRDMSGSTNLVEKKDYPGKTLQDSIADYLYAAAKDRQKKPQDKIGVISFQEQAQVDAMPATELRLDTRGIPDHGNGTDVSKAIELALASMSPDANHRILLIYDGNETTGNLDSAVAAAKSQGIPIDVMPLNYDVQNAVRIEHFDAPTWKRENEPFVLRVMLSSSGTKNVPGTLEVYHRTDRDNILIEPPRTIVLKPGPNVATVHVPALQNAGVHRFIAKFTPDPAALRSSGGTISTNIDKINQPADAITFVRGQGQVLYVDNYRDDAGNRGPGKRFEEALAAQAGTVRGKPVNKINVRTIGVDQFPQNLIDLQNYDAIVLGNVPRGTDGLTPEQDKMLAQYVHDMGGGVVMMGGENAFGAGGWQGSEMEKVLPVDMDIPAQRQVGQGALVLVMHSCEMPNGNYWGVQCAKQAIKTLSEHDEVGIISYSWNGAGGGGGGIGGASWDFVLQNKGSGSAVNAAADKMQLGDMPSFDDAMNLALNGANGGPGLLKSHARHKHVIIISDGDPAPPQAALMGAYKSAKVSVSTITVYPHGSGTRPPVMEDMPAQLGGRPYGPIESNPNQLPQIFIKEATIVRRSLIHEEEEGIPLKLVDSSDSAAEAFAGFQPPPVFGMVLTSKKNDPKVTVPIVAGKMSDPILADWQAGLGKTVVFTTDPTAKWGSNWVSSAQYDAFCGNMVHSVERPPMSEDFEVQTTVNGTKGKITVEALNKKDEFQSFLSIGGQVLDPNGKALNVRLVQTGPGTYEANFDANDPGSYAVALSYHGKQNGYLRGGVAVNSEPEYRELKSNDTALAEIADKTGGRVLNPWDAANADLFSRQNVVVTASPLPVWDWLIPILLALVLIDVASRRIAWDWNSIRRMGLAVNTRIRAFTVTRKVDTRQSLDALRRVREETGESKFRPPEGPTVKPPTVPSGARPDPKAKFEAKAPVAGDITQVVGGASDKPIPPAPKKIEPKGSGPDKAGYTSSLLEAKRRAQEQIRKKEEGDKGGKPE